MSCYDPFCKVIPCLPTDTIPAYTGSFSLQSGTLYTSPTIVVPLPGGGSYIAPPGTYHTILPPGTGPTYAQTQYAPIICPSGSSLLTGCSNQVSIYIPAGATSAQRQSLVNTLFQRAAAASAACCIAASHNPNNPTIYSSGSSTVNCPVGNAINVIGQLPGPVSATSSGLSIAPGVFTSQTSQYDADLKASTYLATLLSGGAVQCGWWNQAQSMTCLSGNTKTVPAHTYFSTVSQQDADNQAIAQLPALCAGLANNMVWASVLTSHDPGTIVNLTPNGTVGYSCFANGSTPGGGSKGYDCSVSTTQLNSCVHSLTYYYSVIVTSSVQPSGCYITPAVVVEIHGAIGGDCSGSANRYNCDQNTQSHTGSVIIPAGSSFGCSAHITSLCSGTSHFDLSININTDTSC